jgi:hypothetical protein
MSLYSLLSLDSQTGSSTSNGSAPTCGNVECCRARAVTWVPAGEVRVISVTRRSHSLTRRTTSVKRQRSLPLRDYDDFSSDHGSHSRSSQEDCSDSSCTNKPDSNRSVLTKISQYESLSIPKRRVARMPPSVPLLEAALKMHSPSSSLSAAAEEQGITVAEWLQDEKTFPNRRSPTFPSSSTSTNLARRKTSRLPSGLTMSRLGKGLGRRNSTASSSIADLPPISNNQDSISALPPVPAGSQYSALAMPSRSQSVRTRMVARGANERAPVIKLPPFPSITETRDESPFAGIPQRRRHQEQSFSPAAERQSFSSQLLCV